MQLESILTPERTKAKTDGVSKKRVLELLAKTFCEAIDGFDVDDLYHSFLGREKLGTTGIGGGIAIPHCRFNTGGATFCVCLSLSSPIDFDAIDGEPVDIIFAILVPEDAESSHLATLASLAELLQGPNIVGKLRAAKNDNELYSVATDSN